MLGSLLVDSLLGKDNLGTKVTTLLDCLLQLLVGGDEVAISAVMTAAIGEGDSLRP